MLRAGISASATINGTEPPIIGWDNNPTATIQEFVNSKSGGHPSILTTITDGGLFTIDVDYDDASNVWASPISLYPGITLTNVRLYVTGGPSYVQPSWITTTAPTASYWSYPSAVVIGNPTRVTVAGKVATRVLCRASGPFAPPGQSVQ